MSVRVKICGVTCVADAHAALQSGADAIGLNFYPPSPRAVTLAQAMEVVSGLDAGACTVGVFVNAPRDEIARVVQAVGIRAIQLHGNEAPEDCAGWEDLTVIKALSAGEPGELAARAARYSTDYVLIDTPWAGFGGSGQTFAWAMAAAIPRERLMVAGGLTPDTVASAVRALRPAWVDVASGVEVRPGQKDHEKIEAFIRAAKAS
jgi:phosphoribosylanthranilate isomerase